MGCPSTTLKIILNIINTLMLIGAVAILAFAIYYIKSLPTIYIVYLLSTAVLSLFIAILGCCGICKEHVGLTKAYAVLILVSLILQLIGKFALVNVEKGKIQAREGVIKQWEKEMRDPGAMDGVQILYQCCGKDSAFDYQQISHPIPKTCYSDLSGDAAKLNAKGCLLGADEFITKTYQSSAAGEWGSLVLTAIMFAFACYLAVRFSKKQRRYNYN